MDAALCVQQPRARTSTSRSRTTGALEAYVSEWGGGSGARQEVDADFPACLPLEDGHFPGFAIQGIPALGEGKAAWIAETAVEGDAGAAGQTSRGEAEAEGDTGARSLAA